VSLPPARSPSDVDVLAGAIFLLAAALVTNPLLHALAGSDGATTLLARLAPRATIDRLWVVFVLIPAAVTFVGIGVPYAFRVLITLVRRRLTRTDVTTTLALALCAALVAADLLMKRSGLLPLALTCAVAIWRAGAAYAARGQRLAPALVATAGIALLGVAYYQQGIRAGARPSIAIAPTLVLAAFYTGFVGLLGASVAAARPRASVRFAVMAGVVGLAWCAGLRALPLLGSGAETAEVVLTMATGGALVALALAAKRDRPDPR